MTTEELIITVLGSSLLASIFGSLVTQWFKIHSDKEMRKFLQKEERFFTILTDVVGFTVSGKDVGKRRKLIESYRQIWLYASDKSIRAINSFFRSVGVTPKKWEDRSNADKKTSKMILQLRKDFYGKTKLEAQEYLIIAIKSP